MKRPISTLLFDVMDTLVLDPIHEPIPSFFGMRLHEYFLAKDRESWLAFERGEISEEEHYVRMFRDGREVDREAFRATLVSGYQWMDGMRRLVAELYQQRVAMYALSNYPEWWQLIDEKLKLSRFIHWDFVSCKTGLRKSKPEAYLNATRALGIAPHEALFIDDREKNCKGALAVGMPAHKFENAVVLRSALKAAHILK